MFDRSERKFCFQRAVISHTNAIATFLLHLYFLKNVSRTII